MKSAFKCSSSDLSTSITSSNFQVAGDHARFERTNLGKRNAYYNSIMYLCVRQIIATISHNIIPYPFVISKVQSFRHMILFQHLVYRSATIYIHWFYFFKCGITCLLIWIDDSVSNYRRIFFPFERVIMCINLHIMLHIY